LFLSDTVTMYISATLRQYCRAEWKNSFPILSLAWLILPGSGPDHLTGSPVPPGQAGPDSGWSDCIGLGWAMSPVGSGWLHPF
jgi:hypothetical protein